MQLLSNSIFYYYYYDISQPEMFKYILRVNMKEYIDGMDR
jgi:CRISPR/Cas system-associated protein Cas7 (RAMP superfamily)